MGPFIGESRRITYAIVFGVWGMVAVYAVLHDQYIVRIAPEHFTVYHPPMRGVHGPEWLAFVYAVRSSLAPGLILGLALARVARHGPGPKVSVRFTLVGSALVVLVTELLAAASGLWVHRTGRLPYPEEWYPDDDPRMKVTTTIQASCYLLGAVFSGILLAWTAWKRRR